MTDAVCGFPFPFRLDPVTGGVPLVRGRDKVQQNLVHLLVTDPGERVMLRDYGGGLRAVVQDPNNDALRAIMQRQLDKSIRRFEPRAEFRQVLIRQEPVQGLFWADLRYAVRPDPEPTSVEIPLAAALA